ncbi:MAG: ATP-dependent DNA helicase [Deltaproteobacteria bacterium]|nr:ATP-dependent DNA helicase [Deltaproteobacteria bacterium]
MQIAVRRLVSHVLASGDLTLTFHSTRRTNEAIRAHQKIQRSRPAGYLSEVTVTHQHETQDFILTVAGRIDGVYHPDPSETGAPIYVEEIKTTTGDLDRIQKTENPLHWGQAKAYAYMYAQTHGLPQIDIHLTYYQLDTRKQTTLKQTASAETLAAFFSDLVGQYLHWAATLVSWRKARDTGLLALSFPYPTYRPGQRSLAVNVYNAIRQERQLMVQAPTGIGKTMATLFPAVKALGKGFVAKIFYLTARTTARTVAEAALHALRGQGMRIKSLTLTAKDKICFEPDAACNGVECPYAKGFYDRIQDAVSNLFSGEDAFGRDMLISAARKHQVCPFELSLELARWADVVICDYNYAFDPRVYLRRFFLENPDAYTFLVDEAHNLVDRSRDMFSAQLFKEPVLALRRHLKTDQPGLYESLGRINHQLVKLRKECELAGDTLSCDQAPKALYEAVRLFLFSAERWLMKNTPASFREELLDCYFTMSSFIRIFEQYDTSYTTVLEKLGPELRVKLFCMDPSAHLAEALTRCRSAIFFSATLTPLTYFHHLFGCDDSAGQMVLDTPFPRENFCLLMANRISTRYRDRPESLPRVADAIFDMVSQRNGNYLIFFPSYAYLTAVHDQLNAHLDGIELLVQTPGMDEAARDAFLETFSQENDRSLVGFVVMGGIFAEGIDLVGERLSGAVVVGVGLPAICVENDLIRDYFNRTADTGFAYAYLYPGMNRVLQAAGRVIRTESDRGVVMLIDERFAGAQYAPLLPDHWQPVRVNGTRQIQAALVKFWEPTHPITR